MARHLKATLEVDNVGQMDKTGAKCILKGEGILQGESVDLALTISCEDRELFEGMGINRQMAQIEIVIQDPAQQKLPGE